MRVTQHPIGQSDACSVVRRVGALATTPTAPGSTRLVQVSGWVSAPLASQRSCQVRPGCCSSQSSSAVRPRFRLRRTSALPDRNGGLDSRSATSARGCSVSGHVCGAGRGGYSRRPGAAAAWTGELTGAAVPIVMMSPRRSPAGCRTGPAAPRAGSRAPVAQAPASRPAGRGGRGDARPAGPGRASGRPRSC